MDTFNSIEEFNKVNEKRKKEVPLDLSKDITMIIRYDESNLAIFTINIDDVDIVIRTRHERGLKKERARLLWYADDPNKDKVYEDFVKYTNLKIKRFEALIEHEKVKKMIFLAYAKEQDLSVLGGLYVAKVNKIFSSILELTEEIVELGGYKEDKYLEDANRMKQNYLNLEEQMNIYNRRKSIIVTNNKVTFKE